ELTADTRAREQLLGFHAQIRVREKEITADDALDAATIANMESLGEDVPHSWYMPFLTVRLEMAPDPSCRVVLGDEKDALGLRRGLPHRRRREPHPRDRRPRAAHGRRHRRGARLMRRRELLGGAAAVGVGALAVGLRRIGFFGPGIAQLQAARDAAHTFTSST